MEETFRKWGRKFFLLRKKLLKNRWEYFAFMFSLFLFKFCFFLLISLFFGFFTVWAPIISFVQFAFVIGWPENKTRGKIIFILLEKIFSSFLQGNLKRNKSGYSNNLPCADVQNLLISLSLSLQNLPIVIVVYYHLF